MVAGEEKTCASCGRRIEWRKKWEHSWSEVRYCSTACRRRGVNDVDRELESVIAEALSKRTSVAFDDLTRACSDQQPEDVKRAVRRLVAAGRVEMVQRGRVADPSTTRGAFEVRRSRGR